MFPAKARLTFSQSEIKGVNLSDGNYPKVKARTNQVIREKITNQILQDCMSVGLRFLTRHL